MYESLRSWENWRFEAGKSLATIAVSRSGTGLLNGWVYNTWFSDAASNAAEPDKELACIWSRSIVIERNGAAGHGFMVRDLLKPPVCRYAAFNSYYLARTTYKAIRLRESQKRQKRPAQRTMSEKIIDHAMSRMHCDGSQ